MPGSPPVWQTSRSSPVPTKGVEPAAADALLTEVQAELRLLARAKMAREQPGHTPQPSALVHEGWLGLGDQPSPKRPRVVTGPMPGSGCMRGCKGCPNRLVKVGSAPHRRSTSRQRGFFMGGAG